MVRVSEHMVAPFDHYPMMSGSGYSGVRGYKSKRFHGSGFFSKLMETIKPYVTESMDVLGVDPQAIATDAGKAALAAGWKDALMGDFDAAMDKGQEAAVASATKAAYQHMEDVPEKLLGGKRQPIARPRPKRGRHAYANVPVGPEDVEGGGGQFLGLESSSKRRKRARPTLY